MKYLILFLIFSAESFAENFYCKLSCYIEGAFVHLLKDEDVLQNKIRYSLYVGQEFSLAEGPEFKKCEAMARQLNEGTVLLAKKWKHFGCDDWVAYEALMLVFLYEGHEYLLRPQVPLLESLIVRLARYNCEGH